MDHFDKTRTAAIIIEGDTTVVTYTEVSSQTTLPQRGIQKANSRCITT